MARQGSAVLSASDKKAQVKSLKGELRNVDSQIKALAKARKDLDKQETKLNREKVQLEAKILALSPAPTSDSGLALAA